MYRSRSNYWSCSVFADWLRKVLKSPSKPQYATMEEWNKWRTNFSKSNSFTYWLVEEFLDEVQNKIMFPADVFNEIRHYIRNRFIDKLQYLPTNLPKGEYYDVRERLLCGMFGTLVDFVEIEKAHMHLLFHCNRRSVLGNWIHVRSHEDGMKYLEWEATLDDPALPETDRSVRQAEVAREIIELYKWWKDVRANRISPYDFDNWFEIEEQYNKEEEAMMIRLCKIRLGLWT